MISMIDTGLLQTKNGRLLLKKFRNECIEKTKTTLYCLFKVNMFVHNKK